MRPPAPPLAGLVSLVLAFPLMAQERLADLLSDPTVRLSRPADRAKVVARLQKSDTQRRHNARARASLLGLPLRTVSPNGRIQEIADFNGDRPLYLTTQNVDAAISTGAALLWTSPYSLTGAGVTIGLWDGGSGRASHQEFGGRLIVMDGSSSTNHATHVGGTLIASGVNPTARGMASSATVKSHDWISDTVEMAALGATNAGDPDKIYLSSHSYGFVSGWNYVNNSTRTWEWHGSGTNSAAAEDDFGRYNDLARDSDSLAFNAPYYLIFRSAGNDRTDNPSPGQNVALSPGGAAVPFNEAIHPAGDGNYRGGFETIGYNAVAKNVITIGSASDAVSGGLRDPAVALVNSFSSWGPTDDGRIKPDIVANGDGVYSSLNSSNTSYGTYKGTSMATPNAAGSAALLVQQFGNLFSGQAMRSSTLKGLLIHTADDLGNVGPDYKFGWGLVNVQSAADLIRDHSEFPGKQRVTEDELTSTVSTRTHSFVWDGVSPISATLCWTDPAGAAMTGSDSRSARLVNNLNLKITAPDGSEILPFVMPFVGTWTLSSMNSPAITGVNNTDNVEQVRIASPPVAGVYQATITFSGQLADNKQNYSLLLSGASATPPPPVIAAASSTSAESISDQGVIYQIIRTTSASLAVAASDVGGKSALTYTWSVAGEPPHPVLFSANDAATMTATFGGPGDYQIAVTAQDSEGLTAFSTVRLRVLQTATGLTVSPAISTLSVGSTQPFGAILLDQFGVAMVSQPSTFTWEASGGGTIDSAGLFTALSAGGGHFVTARDGGISSSAGVTVVPGRASIVLADLSQTYDGAPKPVVARTNPENLPVTITYDGNPTPPTAPGTYTVMVVVNDINLEGSASDTLVIVPGNDFISWKNIYFNETERIEGLAGDHADPDGDSHSNLTEYALGTHPRQFTPQPVPTRNQDGLSFTFTRPENLPGISYEVESSEDLRTWRPVLLELLTPGTIETLRARDPLDVGNPAQRFLRLRISRQ